MNINKSTILLTGGTGSFGRAFTSYLLSEKKFQGVIRIFSRDEFKQHQMQIEYQNDPRIRFFIGDVRDSLRLERATKGANVLIHAAALKQVPLLEYNPFEAVKTNILGSQNVIDCAIDQKVKRVILISSDKAVSPVNLYGATKMVAERIFVQANSYSGGVGTIFSVARYGNVMGSRGSVVSVFMNQAKNNYLSITDERMTRFWMTLQQGVLFVLTCLEKMRGGEIFVPKLPSIRITDLAKVISPQAKIKITGIRQGEKIDEVLINTEETRRTLDLGNYLVIEPEFPLWGKKQLKGRRIGDTAIYSSGNNHFLSVLQIKKMLKDFNE